MISLDTETTGVDLRHGAKPYFVTITQEDHTQLWWEWDVDPLTREPVYPQEDLDAIRDIIDREESFVLQNCKFDFRALSTVGIQWSKWDCVDDTLIAGHLLASNQPHDLTSMALWYLNKDIKPYEDALEEACKQARALCRKHLPDWCIAKEGLQGMPSAKATVWKYDGWLPRAICLWAEEENKLYLGSPADKRLKCPWWTDFAGVDHTWRTVLSDYANVDSDVTLELWREQKKEIERRGLRSIYKEAMRLPKVIYGMETRGVTVNLDHLEECRQQYRKESEQARNTCHTIAKKLGYELVLPKAGNNKSLTEFIFNGLKLPVVKKGKETGKPSLDKEAMEIYESTTEPGSIANTFITALRDKRKKDTTLAYLDGYESYFLPWGGSKYPQWKVLYPSINQTGTDTLRLSSSSPNSQNVSRQSQQGRSPRYIFGPAPGREWWSLDAENIELRIPAYVSGEESLIDLFERPNDPPFYGSMHLLNFSVVYPDLWQQAVDKVGSDKAGPYCKKEYATTWYQWCKNGDFSLQYGAQEDTADRAFRRRGSHTRLKSKFEILEELNQKCIRQAEEQGYVETLPDLSVDPLHGYPLLCTRTEYGKVLPTVPLCYMTQGTACWWARKAMVIVYNQLESWRRLSKFDGYLIMYIHDELVLDFPKSKTTTPEPSNLPKVRIIQKLMQIGGEDIGVPTPVGVKYHPDNWEEGTTF